MCARISQINHASILAQVEPLRLRGGSTGSQSGYKNVYFSKTDPNGVSIWVAKIKTGGKLRTLNGSRSTQPHVTALFVAKWYEDAFGPDWATVVAARKQQPFHFRYSPRFKGYLAAVWVQGRREEVVEMRPTKCKRWRPTGKLAVFASAAEARAGVKVYLTRRYGLFGESLAWRTKNDKGQAFAHPSRAA